MCRSSALQAAPTTHRPCQCRTIGRRRNYFHCKFTPARPGWARQRRRVLKSCTDWAQHYFGSPSNPGGHDLKTEALPRREPERDSVSGRKPPAALAEPGIPQAFHGRALPAARAIDGKRAATGDDRGRHRRLASSDSAAARRGKIGTDISQTAGLRTQSP